MAAYFAAKHGVVGLTRALALEVARKGVTVNAVCPGYTETEILRDSIANIVAKTGRSVDEARAEFAGAQSAAAPHRCPRRWPTPSRGCAATRRRRSAASAISVSGGEVT